MSLTIAEVLSFIAISVTFYGVFSQRRYRQSQESINFTASDSTNVKDALTLKAEYKAEMKDLKAQLTSALTELKNANMLIEELQARDEKREVEMVEMRSEFERDKITRDEVVRALTDKVAALEQAVQERDKLIESLRTDLNQKTTEMSERDLVIVGLQAQITKLQSQQSGFGARR